MRKFAKASVLATLGLSVAMTGLSVPVFAEEASGPRKIVTFIDEGTTVSQQIVYDSDCLYEPEALGKDGYVFRGWFDGDEEADFWTCDQTVSEDRETKTYTAKYVEADFRVNFMVSDDTLETTVFSSQQIANGDTASEPTETPERAGYEVTGWMDENGNDFDFSTPITENIDLYPIFSPAETTYKVFIYKENEDDEGAYVLVDDDELTDLTGNTISLSDDDIDSYLTGLKNNAYYELDEINYVDETVKADGTSKVEVYFKRKEYTIVLTNNNYYRIYTGDQNRGATYTITGIKIGASVSDWPTSVRQYPYGIFNVVNNYDGWKLNGGSLILGKTQTIYTAEMLGDGSKDTLTYTLVMPQWQGNPWTGFTDANEPNQEETSVDSDTEIEEEENEPEEDPVYVIVEVEYVGYDYSGASSVKRDVYKFVRGEGGLTLVPSYDGEYPETTDAFVGWTYDDLSLPYQSHHTSADYFFENDLVDIDALAAIFCESEDEDCTVRLFATFDYEPEDGWFQEIEDDEEEVEEVEEEEENPLTLDEIYNVIAIAILVTVGLGVALFALKRDSKEA